MESPYYEITHDFEEENRLFQSGYVKGYHDAVMKCPDIVRCKDCRYWQDNNDGYPHQNCKWNHDETPDPDDYCSAGERKEGR